MSFGSALRRSLSCYVVKSEPRRPLPHGRVCFKQSAAAATPGTSRARVFPSLLPSRPRCAEARLAWGGVVDTCEEAGSILSWLQSLVCGALC